jgi:hypothetical protein
MSSFTFIIVKGNDVKKVLLGLVLPSSAHSFPFKVGRPIPFSATIIEGCIHSRMGPTSRNVVLHWDGKNCQGKMI